MKVSDFDFLLPEDRIALAPVDPRDACKMLQVSKFFFDFQFRDLPDLLNSGDVLVLNDSKVIPARLYARKANAKIELLLHKPGDETWLAFAKPAKKLNIGDRLHIAEGFEAEVRDKHDSGEVTLCFRHSEHGEAEGDAMEESTDPSSRKALTRDDIFYQLLEQHGHVPLPPYIKRDDTMDDRADYQTVYADRAGSVAAPTAGLHFTPELLDRCHNKGIGIERLTLHVGAGTFQPVKVADTDEHVMHSEWAELPADVAERLNTARAGGGKIVAVGTTAMRTLESAVDENGIIHPFCDETDIFITPGFTFRAVDRLITNFHLPKSTLFMLVCAFSGTERMKAAYQHAIESGYRFYSYGDACLLDRMT